MRGLRIDDLELIAVPEQAELSPDGTRVVYTLRKADVECNATLRTIWSVDTSGGEPRQLTLGPDDSSPVWSPDGTRLAFLRADDRPPQVCVLPLDGGEIGQLTSLPLGAGAPTWSPDGTRLAFVAPTAPAVSSAEDVAARRLEPIVADRLDYQADGKGLRRDRNHVHVLDFASGDCRQLTSGDWDARHLAWSPDGATLGFAASPAPDADLLSRSPIYTVDVAAPAPTQTPSLVGLEDGVGAAITWTADGRALLVAGATQEGIRHTRLLLVPLDGCAAVDLAPNLDRNVMPGQPGYPGARPQLAGDGRTALFCVRDRGCTHVYSVSLDGGAPRPVIAGPSRSVSSLSVAGERVAAVLATDSSFGEVVVLDLAAGTESTRTNHGAPLAGIELVRREEREFTVSDGTVVHGWILRDPARDGPMPLVLDVHGGPHNAWKGTADEVHLYHEELVARGWVVLLLNPRGSDGYGESFYTAGLGAPGVADAVDVLEPIDALVAEGVADPSRLAVTGYSYGGFMTCYLTSRDRRFAAAVAGGLISDLVSMAGTSDMAHFISEYEYGGRPWAERERYEASSPLAQVDRVETPTLILHGGADMRCPLGQAQQWHTALRERGVPTRLVVYPEASHLFVLNGAPAQRLDFNRRVVDWLVEYVERNR